MRVQFTEGVELVSQAYPSLTPKLKKCADYILDHPSEVATLSMRELAKRADTPRSNMVRLARTLGFSTYGEFRALFRDSINEQVAGYSLRAGQAYAVARENTLDQALDAFRLEATNTIDALFASIDRAVLERAVQALADARTVFVVGAHGSLSSASHMQHMADAGFRNWHLLARGNTDYARLLGALAPSDAVVCIAMEPYAADTIKVARRAREVGARVIGITDKLTSPLAANSDDTLLVSVRGPSFFPSYVGATVLVEALVGMTAARSDRPAAENAEGRQQWNRDIGEYWNE